MCGYNHYDYESFQSECHVLYQDHVISTVINDIFNLRIFNRLLIYLKCVRACVCVCECVRVCVCERVCASVRARVCVVYLYKTNKCIR